MSSDEIYIMNRFDKLTDVVKEHFLILDIVLEEKGWFILPKTEKWRNRLRKWEYTDLHYDIKTLKLPPDDMTPEEFDIILTMKEI